MLLHFYGKLFPKSRTGSSKHTTILLLLPLLSWYVNTCDHITTYNSEYITDKVIVTYDSN